MALAARWLADRAGPGATVRVTSDAYGRDMGAHHPRVGSDGEHLAAAFLEGRGCRVLRRNVRSGPHEVDLIVDEGGVVAAVEVKYTSRRGHEPLDAVDDAKLDRVRRAAVNAGTGAVRIDLLGVTVSARFAEVRWLVGVP